MPSSASGPQISEPQKALGDTGSSAQPKRRKRRRGGKRSVFTRAEVGLRENGSAAAASGRSQPAEKATETVNAAAVPGLGPQPH
ncbi:MAG: hypothetical protein ABJD74_17700, partial [Roseibium sp.]